MTAIGLALTMCGCVPASPARGLHADVGAAVCEVDPTSGEAILRIPLAPASDNHFEQTWLFGVTLMEADNLAIVGMTLVDHDRAVGASPAPTGLADQLREAGSNLRPPPTVPVDDHGVLAVLLRPLATDRVGSAESIRLEWSAGEPVYYQDETISLAVGETCELQRNGRSAPQSHGNSASP
jgi:hypothetical protein